MISDPKAVILCVDDEENALTLRKRVLQKAGYEVLTALSGREALAILASRRVDLVLTDHLMPGITGLELARQVKSQHPGIQVVLLSVSRPIRNVPILSYLEMSPFLLFIFVCCFCRWNAS